MSFGYRCEKWVKHTVFAFDSRPTRNASSVVQCFFFFACDHKLFPNVASWINMSTAYAALAKSLDGVQSPLYATERLVVNNPRRIIAKASGQCVTGTETICSQLMVWATYAATSGCFGCNDEELPFERGGGGGGGCVKPGLFMMEMWNGPPMPPRACKALDFTNVYLKLGTSMVSNHF